MRRLPSGIAVGLLANSVLTLLPQLVALLTLPIAEFGRFSIVYLVFAWGISLQMSVVSEPAGRARARGDDPGASSEFRAAATWLALAVGGLSCAMAGVLWQQAVIAAATGVAVAAACFRVAGRYRAVMDRQWTLVARSDVAGIVVFMAVYALMRTRAEGSLLTLIVAWGSAMVTVNTLGVPPRLTPPSAFTAWIRARRDDIAPLLTESLVMDAGAIGAPYAVAPLIGITDFGVYRALSNVAAPIRLLVESVRPLMSTNQRARLRWRLGVLVAVLVLPLGAAVVLALWALGRTDWQVGVLTALTVWAVPAGIFVAANLVASVFYAAGRVHLSRRLLWHGRLSQTLLAVVLPILGAWLGGLTGAIWCYVTSTVLGAVVWAALTLRSLSD